MEQNPFLSLASFSETLTNFGASSITTILFLTFLLVGIIFTVITLILVYHWNRYEIDPATASRLKRRYYMQASILAGIALVSIVTYSFSL